MSIRRLGSAARAFKSREDRRAEAAEVSQGLRREFAQRRRAPAPLPDFTFGEMLQAEAQSQRRGLPVQGGRYQQGSSKEIKSFDLLVTSPAASINWTLAAAAFVEPGVAYTGITELNGVAQGNGVYERVGVKILIRSIRLRIMFLPLASPSAGFVRCAVVYDRQPNGGAPPVATLFQDLRVGGATTTDVASGINIANKNRFTVLRDQIVTFDTYSKTAIAVDWFIPCRLNTDFGGPGSAITDITTGSILLVMGAFNSISALQMNYCRSRIRYED